MNVSARHIAYGLAALAGVAILSTGLAVAAGNGGAACCKGGKPGQGINVPGVGMAPPAYTPGPVMGAPMKPKSPGCCTTPKTHGVHVPGIHVPAPSISVTTPNVTVKQGSVTVGGAQFIGGGVNVFGGGGSSSIIIGGGGGYYPQPGVAPSALGGLNVTGGEERIIETVTETVPTVIQGCVEKVTRKEAIRPISAVCIDDTGTPHPASRLDDSHEIRPDYHGEVFRCMAGTRMQVTVGEMMDGKASFTQGQSFACKKGEALVHHPDGRLACAVQAPERNCNERSLLRKYGPGIKLVRTTAMAKVCQPTQQTVMKPVTREVVRIKPNSASPIVFDGGVGQGVN